MRIEDFKLAYELVDVLVQTKEWNNIRRNDPRIQASKRRLQATLDCVAEKVSAELLDELTGAALDLEEASADAATLYGIRAAVVVQEVINNPMLFSQMFLERATKRNKKMHFADQSQQSANR